MLAGFFGQERKEIYQVFVSAYKAFAKFFVLSGNPDRASVHVTFAHHHTTQNNQCTGGKTEFFGSQQGRYDDIVTGFELAVGL